MCHPELVERTARYLRRQPAVYFDWIEDDKSDLDLVAETIRRNDVREIVSAHCAQLREFYPQYESQIARIEQRPHTKTLGDFRIVGDVVDGDVAYVIADTTHLGVTRFAGTVWMLKRHDTEWRVFSDDYELGLIVMPKPIHADLNGKLRVLYPSHSQWSS